MHASSTSSGTTPGTSSGTSSGPSQTRHPGAPGRARPSVPLRRAQLLAAVLLTGSLALAGCGANDGGNKSAAGSAADGPADLKEQAPADAAGPEGAQTGSGSAKDESGAKASAPLAEQHIIRTASVSVRVKDVLKALDEARDAAETAGGIVGSESTDRDSGGHERSRVVLRVPQDRYKEVLNALSGSGTLLSRKESAEDVTQEVVDVDSRIKSQRVSVARIRELMDRATKLSDVVTLEGELSTRQADLESLLAQQSSLKDRTSLATITLTLSETAAKPPAKEDDDPGFVDAVTGGWSAFLTMLRWLSVVIGAVLPFLAVGAVLFLAWLKLVRPLRNRWAATVPAPAAPPAPASVPAQAPGSLPVAPPLREQGERD
ncbi:DUF4349 domain-containing protein [Streptomyces sp. NPDC058001]|uniref:DUF4349 domain-containing protein n=1 Tax=Streptomyces sp. NPDC058001 TaxID=3346300 RepID=UPI0036ED49EF